MPEWFVVTGESPFAAKHLQPHSRDPRCCPGLVPTPTLGRSPLELTVCPGRLARLAPLPPGPLGLHRVRAHGYFVAHGMMWPERARPLVAGLRAPPSGNRASRPHKANRGLTICLVESRLARSARHQGKSVHTRCMYVCTVCSCRLTTPPRSLPLHPSLPGPVQFLNQSIRTQLSLTLYRLRLDRAARQSSPSQVRDPIPCVRAMRTTWQAVTSRASTEVPSKGKGSQTHTKYVVVPTHTHSLALAHAHTRTRIHTTLRVSGVCYLSTLSKLPTSQYP